MRRAVIKPGVAHLARAVGWDWVWFGICQLLLVSELGWSSLGSSREPGQAAQGESGQSVWSNFWFWVESDPRLGWEWISVGSRLVCRDDLGRGWWGLQQEQQRAAWTGTSWEGSCASTLCFMLGLDSCRSGTLSMTCAVRRAGSSRAREQPF